MARAAETTHEELREDFPSCGFRARRWLRFERDLTAWLATPEGQFAAWEAAQSAKSE